MELIHIENPNFEIMQKIIELEESAFEGAGNVDLWIIKALIRYGMVFIVKEGDKIVCIVEYMQIFNKKSLFLYGISTLKEYRHKGYANFILNETEKILKDLGYTEIELTVAPENQIAIDLYKKHGYKQESFLKDEYGTGVDRFMRMINECDEIALATSIHDMPNVRIVNYYYDQDNNIMYFATYKGREKISEFWKNNNVAFTTIPMKKGVREQVRARGHVRESEKTIVDLREEFSNKMSDFAEIIDKYSEELKVYEIRFTEATVTLDSRTYEKISL